MGGNDLFCNVCNSTNIIQASGRLICRDCATVLRDPVYRQYSPYNDQCRQNEPLNRLQMGTSGERNGNGRSYQLSRLYKLNSLENNEKLNLERAHIEVSRIFGNLSLPLQYKSIVLKQYTFIRSKRPMNVKYKAPEYLIPFITYFCCKINNVSIRERDLLEISNLPRTIDGHSSNIHELKIPQKLINKLKSIVLEFYPQYKEREKKRYILQLLEELRVHFGLDLSFYYLAKQILYKLWGHISEKRDSTIVGEIACVVAACFLENEISIHAICKKIGISASTPQKRIREDVFDFYKYTGFTTLKKSAGLLKKILILENMIEDTESMKPYYREMLKWMTKVPEFYVFKNTQYYLFMFQKSKTEVIITYFNCNNVPTNAPKPHKNNVRDALIFKLDFSKYSVKDPPIYYHFIKGNGREMRTTK